MKWRGKVRSEASKYIFLPERHSTREVDVGFFHCPEKQFELQMHSKQKSVHFSLPPQLLLVNAGRLGSWRGGRERIKFNCPLIFFKPDQLNIVLFYFGSGFRPSPLFHNLVSQGKRLVTSSTGMFVPTGRAIEKYQGRLLFFPSSACT